MRVDCTETYSAGTICQPRIAIVAGDEFAARRVESALEAHGMLVLSCSRGSDQFLASVDELELEFDVLVVAVGSGLTERDHQMRQLRKRGANAHLVAVMPEDSRRGVRRALEAGADGVVFESEVEATLALTVLAVCAGQTAVPAAGRHAVDRPTLSSREKQVLGMVVAGMSNKAIAGELYLAESTVKCHLSSSFAKLGVRSRNEAADLILHSGSEYAVGVLAGAHATTEGIGQ